MSVNHTMKIFPQVELGILGGTGLYEIEGFEDIQEIALETPFGSPSDIFHTGNLVGKRVAFLSRHGKGHCLLPSEINYRANIYGFKLLGAKRLLSVNSVGSLKENIHPRDMVLPDQFFDRTHRANTFFGEGVVGHISFAQPVCPDFSGLIFQVAKELGMPVHPSGVYICIEGPAFSSKAESRIYRSWGCDVIGMTASTEARLAREAEICYTSLSLVTDYDVWHDDEVTVSVELILENLKKNIAGAKKLIREIIPRLSTDRTAGCPCQDALKNVMVTAANLIPLETKKNLTPIIGKYLKA
ncbi:MAG: S-methyl-5'-thioadenosine phosphorylase [Acidobacteriota bacterium]